MAPGSGRAKPGRPERDTAPHRPGSHCGARAPASRDRPTCMPRIAGRWIARHAAWPVSRSGPPAGPGCPVESSILVRRTASASRAPPSPSLASAEGPHRRCRHRPPIADRGKAPAVPISETSRLNRLPILAARVRFRPGFPRTCPGRGRGMDPRARGTGLFPVRSASPETVRHEAEAGLQNARKGDKGNPYHLA